MDEKKADRSELPNISELATKSELDNKADRSEITSLEGYATEEYVNNAVANAGGSSNSGNYLKLVDDLDNYEGTEGEIVKYSGNSNDKYIQGADYKYRLSYKNITVSSTGNSAIRYQIKKCDNSNFNNYHIIGPGNESDVIIDNENIPSDPFMYNNSDSSTCVYYLGNLELNKDVIVKYYDVIKYGTVSNIDSNSATITFENTNITIYVKSIQELSLKLGVIEEIAKIIYLWSKPDAFLFYDNNKLKMVFYTRTDGITLTTPYNIIGDKRKFIELTDFCKRALNIE